MTVGIRLPPDTLPPMRIAVDSRALLAERTGIGTYTHAIARGLAALDGTEIGLFSPRSIADYPRGPRISVHADRHPLGLAWV